MRMPGMDGAELLGRIREEHPRVVRIVMSGQAERDGSVRALPGAQQFLSKPCESEELRRVIDRAAELSRLLNDEALRSAVGRLDKLPSSSATFHELSRLASSPDARIDDIASIVENDPAMAAKVLQLVNSAYFGLARPSASIRHAVSYLGRRPAQGAHPHGERVLRDGGRAGGGFSIDELQRHSLLVARLAKRFLSGTRSADGAFTAGLMHDIGKIILALGMPERAADVLQEVRRRSRSWHAIEKERFGVTHAEVGAYLLGAWGLPYVVVEAVAYHHTPGSVEGDGMDVLAAVHVADALIECRNTEPDTSSECIDLSFLERTGHADRLQEWREVATRSSRRWTSHEPGRPLDHARTRRAGARAVPRGGGRAGGGAIPGEPRGGLSPPRPSLRRGDGGAVGVGRRARAGAAHHGFATRGSGASTAEALAWGTIVSGIVLIATTWRPGGALTRHVVAVGQMTWSALIIHMMHGRIEAHFHLFGGLALLAYYRDARVLVTATIVAGAGHLIQGAFWPEALFGVTEPAQLRFLEHAAWIVFADIGLLLGIGEHHREMRALAKRQAEAESWGSTIEQKVEHRTRQLEASREQYRTLVESTHSIPWQLDCTTWAFVYVGPQSAALLGCAPADWLEPGFWQDRVHPADRAAVEEAHRRAVETGEHVQAEFRMRRGEEAWSWVRSVASPSVEGGGTC